MAGVMALLGSSLTACSGVPDRSAEASAISAELRSLPGVESVDGRYSHEPTMGYSYNVDIHLTADATGEQVLAVAERYHAGLTGSDFSRHTSRIALHLGDDMITVFGNDRHREPPEPEVSRWYRVVRAVPGALGWVIGPDPRDGLRSITLELDRPQLTGDPAQLAGLSDLLTQQAADLADRQWIVRWRKLRLDLLGPQYPATEILTLIAELAATGQWSAIYDPSGAPTLKLAVWAATPELRRATARSHLPRIRSLGVPVSYTVRANRTDPVEVLVGGCLTGGSELQQQLNREFGTC